MIRLVRGREYFNYKEYYRKLINQLFKNDNDVIANTDETVDHLDFIFSNENNDAFLLLNFENDKLVCMVNFLEYDNRYKFWCLFSVFTLKSERKKGLAEEIIHIGLDELKKCKCQKLIAGIEEENIPSIKLHEKIGFKFSGKSWNQIAEGFPSNHLGFIYENI